MKRSEIFSWQPDKLFMRQILFLFCFFALLPPLEAQEFSRQIQVKILASPAFKENLEWEQDVRDRITFVNDVFEPAFGINFSIHSYKNWNPEDETRETSLLIEELRSLTELGKDQVIIGFHRMLLPVKKEVLLDLDVIGTAAFFRGVIVIRDPYFNLQEEQYQMAMTHEFSHLFGAVHAAGENQLMSPAVANQVIKTIDPANSEIIRMAREVDFRKGVDSLSNPSLDGLIRIYESMIRDNPHRDFYHQLGLFYKKRGLIARAVKTWEEAIRFQYDHPMIHFELGSFYYTQSNYDNAIRELGSAVAHFILPSQKKNRATAFNFLGVAYYQKGNLDQAIFNWLKGLSADPDNPELQGNLAAAYLQKGELDRGIFELEKLLAKEPHNATTLSNLGAALMRKGEEIPRAIELFEKALTQESKGSKERSKGELTQTVSEAFIRMNLGAAYLRQNKIPEAIRELERSRTLNSDVYSTRYNLGQAYLRAGRNEQAIKEIQNALRYKKDDPFLYGYLAQAFAATGNDAEAERVSHEGLKYAKGDLRARFHQNLAFSMAKKGKTLDAIAQLKMAINEKWKDPISHTNLGKLYANRGSYDEARRSFKTALRIDPAHKEAKEALNRLEQMKV